MSDESRITMSRMPDERVEIVADNADRCGEGPTWDFREAGSCGRTSPRRSSTATTRALAKPTSSAAARPAGGIGLHKAGGYLLAGPDGLHRLDAAGQSRPIPLDLAGKKPVFNDCIVDPRGRLYVGTYYWGEEMLEPGTLYLIDEKLSARPVAENIELSNGLGFSPDNRTLYFADSTASKISPSTSTRPSAN